MTLLKFVDDQWGPVGSFNWFATHGTSMSRTNPLISGDNKGAAARFMEDWFEQSGVKGIDSDEFGAEGIPRRVSNLISNHPEREYCNSSLLYLYLNAFINDACVCIYVYIYINVVGWVEGKPLSKFSVKVLLWLLDCRNNKLTL